jgi:hypothetical protein
VGNIEYDMGEIDPSSTFNYTWQDLLISTARWCETGLPRSFSSTLSGWMPPSTSLVCRSEESDLGILQPGLHLGRPEVVN